MKRSNVFFAICLFSALSVYAGDFSAWTYCSLLKLNTSSSGANVMGSVSNFPLLVRLSQSNFDFSQSKPDGSDVRFTANDPATHATELTFKIERWDNVNKLAEVWVKVPTILGDNNTQAIKMYWGNSGTLPAAPTDPVFSGTDGFAGVWHLGENPGSTAGGFKDMVGTNNGTGNGGTSSASGVIGNGVNFNSGSNQSITVPNAAPSGSPSTFHPTGNLTVEAWINASSQGQYKRFVAKSFTSATNPWDEYDLQFSGASNTFAFVVSMGSSQYSVTSTTATSTGQWYHVVGTYDQANLRIYVNGNLECTSARTGALSDYGQGLTFGKYQNDNNSNFNGKLDEVRVSFTARSSDWIALSYMNQRSDQKLVQKQTANQFSADPGVLLQKFNGISNGNDIASLTSAQQFPAGPSQTRTLSALDWFWSPTQDGSQDNNFGAKMSGWIQAPATGNYTFNMRADDRGELWLSTDADPVNKVRISYVPSWDSHDAAGWNNNPQQQVSVPIQLQSGKLYYIEALMTQASGDAHMAVGWTMPGGVSELPISAGRVFTSPFDENLTFPSSISLYQRGTSNKKATLGWDASTGPGHFYLETADALHIDNNGYYVATPSDYVSVHASSTMGYDGMASTLVDVFGQRVIESNLSSTGYDYKITNSSTSPAKVTETTITADGITTTGSVTAKSWKIRTPDYVFEKGYRMQSLREVAAYVKKYKHLPEVPSAKEMQAGGMDLAEMNLKLLKKVEELTMHMIEMDKRVKNQAVKNSELQKELAELRKEKIEDQRDLTR